MEIPKVNYTTLLSINVTWYCPVKCSYCHILFKASHRDKTILSKRVLKQEVINARNLGIEDIRFSGGEPIAIGNKLFEYAKIVFDNFGKKPSILTSGIGINDEWLRKASGLFSGILISVENPFNPLQFVTNADKLLRQIKENHSKELPLYPGLTIVHPSDFNKLPEIFDYIYDATDQISYPQLGSLSHRDFKTLSKEELHNLESSTEKIFTKYGYLKYYFTDFIGSLDLSLKNTRRIVVNLNPNGLYGFHRNLMEAIENKKRSEESNDIAQKLSPLCNKCRWNDICNYHLTSLGEIRYDWCDVRLALWKGITKGIEKFAKVDSDTPSNIKEDSSFFV